MTFFLREEGSNNTTARGGELETFNGEGKVIVIGIEDQETVENALLDAFRFIASWDQWAVSTDRDVTLFDAGSLGKNVVVRLDLVDDDAPFAIDVNSAQGLDVTGRARAKICLINQILQSVDRVSRVDLNVLVE